MKDISIIVPFYNSEKYLARCVRSMCEQTISNLLEFVFVNDCSTDASVDVIKNTLNACAFTGDVIFVNHDSNRGAAIARRSGIEAANGKYILFCDSDDWQENNICEELLDKASQNNSDIVVCDYFSIHGEKVETISNCYEEDLVDGLLTCRCTGSLCNKLIRRELVFYPDFIFPQFSFCEDFAYSVQLCILANKIDYVPKALYNYDHRADSIVTSPGINKVKIRLYENLRNYEITESVLRKHGLYSRYYTSIILLKLIIKNSIRNHISDREIFNIWKSTFPELNKEILKTRDIPYRSKLAYFLTYIGLYPSVKRFIS